MYGTTQEGGLYYYGSVFELSGPNYSTYTTLVSFTGPAGSYPRSSPQASLIIDGSGNLYGTTVASGASNYGTVFELAANHTTFTSMVSFTGTTGTYPGEDAYGSLALDSSGNLYGTTEYGGTNDDGTIFEIAANHTTFTSLASLLQNSGSYPGEAPYSGLVLDSSGNLYGTTANGGNSNDGMIFELAANHTTFTRLVSFTGTAGSYPGLYPDSTLAIDSSGNLYGTTEGGGADSDGTVFELGANHTAFTSLFSFTGSSGNYPGAGAYAGLTMDSGGNLYGTTQQGGASGDGTVFELAANHTTFSSLISFTGTSGSAPGINLQGGVILDSSGNLYGTTDSGGSSNDGTVFELAANHATFTSLVSFTGTSGIYPGEHPFNGLTLNSNGNLFGTTSQGGASNDGTVFELASNHTTFSSLISFTGETGNYIGASPRGSLTLDSSGNLYGTTWSGGAYGTIFELAANRTTFTNLISFSGNSGGYLGAGPESDLALDSAGNLYGTTIQGGQGTLNDGTVFELAANHTTFTSLVSFTGNSGSYPGNYPSGSLTIDGAGNLYGTTEVGGASNDGTVFEISANRTTFTSLFSFTGNSGSFPGLGPIPGLTIDGSGNLFGTTDEGGAYGLGSVFEVSTAAIPTQLVFTPAPTNTVAGSGIDAPIGVRVSIENEYGQPITTSNDTIVLSLGSNPAGATLSGTLTATAVNGVANFSNLSINAIGSGYTLVANDTTAPTLSPITSAPFSIGSAVTSISAGNTMTLSDSSSGHSVLVTGGLTIAGTTGAWTGKLDITNNDVDVINGSLATITNQVALEYDHGTWLGEGITSSYAAADSTHLTAIGVIQNNQSGTALFTSTNPFDGTTPGTSDILVKYTYYGDTNLDGKVDGSDYSRIDNGALNHLAGWFNGDFNYDGIINGSDYTLIDNAYNTQGASLAAQIAPAARVSTRTHLTPRPASLFSQLQIGAQPVDLAGTAASIAAEIFAPLAGDWVSKDKVSRIGTYGFIEPGS